MDSRVRAGDLWNSETGHGRRVEGSPPRRRPSSSWRTFQRSSPGISRGEADRGCRPCAFFSGLRTSPGSARYPLGSGDEGIKGLFSYTSSQQIAKATHHYFRFFYHLVDKKDPRVPGFKGSSEILKRKQNLQRKTPAPLTSDVFSTSLGPLNPWTLGPSSLEKHFT